MRSTFLQLQEAGYSSRENCDDEDYIRYMDEEVQLSAEPYSLNKPFSHQNLVRTPG